MTKSLQCLRFPPFGRQGTLGVLVSAIPLLLLAQGKPFEVPTRMMTEGDFRTVQLNAGDRRILLAAIEADILREPQPGGPADDRRPVSLDDFAIGDIQLKAGNAYLAVMAIDSSDHAFARNLCTHGNCSLLLYRRDGQRYTLIFHGGGFAVGVLGSDATGDNGQGGGQGRKGNDPRDIVVALSDGGDEVELTRYTWREDHYDFRSCESLQPRDPLTESPRWWQHPDQATIQPCGDAPSDR